MGSIAELLQSERTLILNPSPLQNIQKWPQFYNNKKCQRTELGKNNMMLLLVLAILSSVVRSKVEENLDQETSIKEVALCPNGTSYCEHVENYPYEAILTAIKGNPELVNTPGLWDQPMGGVDDEGLEELDEYDDVNEDFELYENGIVPY